MKHALMYMSAYLHVYGSSSVFLIGGLSEKEQLARSVISTQLSHYVIHP